MENADGRIKPCAKDFRFQFGFQNRIPVIEQGIYGVHSFPFFSPTHVSRTDFQPCFGN